MDFRPPIKKLLAGSNVTLTPSSGEGEVVSIDAGGGTGGGGSINISAGTTSRNLTNFVLSNSNGVSFGLNGSTVTATVETTYAASNHSHGNPTLALTNINGTTASASNGLTLSLSAAGGAGDGVNILAAGTQTANTTGTILFADSNGISFGMSGSTRITAAHNALTTARASTDAIGLNTAQSNVTWTANSAGLSLDARGYAGTGTTFNGANISASLTNNSNGLQISASVAAPGAGAENNHHHLLGANTAGNTTASGSTIGLSGVNITLSGTNNSVVNISAPATSSLSATGAVSISTNGATISIGAPNAGATASSWQNLPSGGLSTHAGNNITNASKSKRPILFAINLPYQLNGIKSVEYIASRTAGTSLNMTHGFGIYSFGNSTSLGLVASTTNGVSLTTSAQFSGLRGYQITGLDTVTLSPGLYVGALYFSGSNNSTAVANIQLLGAQSFVALVGYVLNGTNSTAATASTDHMFPMNGVYSNTTAGFPSNIGRTDIYGQGDATVNAVPYVQLVNA